MANLCKNIEYLNIVEPNKDHYSAFEVSDLIKFNFDWKIDISKFNLFHGQNYFGFSYEDNLFFKETICKNDCYLKLVNDALFSNCSFDGNYVAVLTKSNILYFINTFLKKIILKQNLKLNNDMIYDMKTIKINNNISEIWLFRRRSILVIRNINFSQINEAVNTQDKQLKLTLSQQIKISDVILPYTNNDSEIVHVNISDCSNSCQILVGILYWDMFVVLQVSRVKQSSIVYHTYKVYLEDIGIDLYQNRSASINFGSDKMNVLIVDGQNKLWICNFLVGYICGTLTSDKETCVRVSVCLDRFSSSDMILIVKQLSDNNAILELISFPKMEKIESFAVTKDTVVFPFNENMDLILLMQSLPTVSTATVASNSALLKSITRLDPNVKLREIIAMNNYEEARKFATIYGLDQEIIYVDELKKLIESWENNQKSLSLEQQNRLLSCVSEIKTYFEYDAFIQLIDITMSSFGQQKLLLNALSDQAAKYRDVPDGNKICDMIHRTCQQFHIYSLMYSTVEYSPDLWKQFRNIDNVTILFTAIKQAKIDVIKKIWDILQNVINDVFIANNSEFCHHLKVLGITMIKNQCSMSKFSVMFDWLTFDVIPKQIDIIPEQLTHLVDVIDVIIRQMEAIHKVEDRSKYISILEKVTTKLLSIYLCANTPKMRANVFAARMASELENVNPVKRLSTLKNDLNQLQRLLNNFRLDLSLDVLSNETGISLAIRILDQTSNNELTSGIVWEKMNNFLKEFEIKEIDFYCQYAYQRLIHRVSFKSENVANDSSGEYSMIFTRFVIILDKIDDKQAQLECLAAFASNADVPFKEQLSGLLQSKIASNCSSNPVIGKLKELMKKSLLTPICSKYGMIYNSKKFKPTNLLLVILKNEFNHSIEQCQIDIDCVMKEFELDDVVLLEQRCRFYTNEIFFKDEIISYDNFKMLSGILVDPTLCKSLKAQLLNFTFTQFCYLLDQSYEWQYDSLVFVCEVGLFLADKFIDEHKRNFWIESFNMLKFSINLYNQCSSGLITLSQILGNNYSISHLQLTDFRQMTMSKYFYDHFLQHFLNIPLLEHFDYFTITDNIFQLIRTKKELCVNVLSLKNFFQIISDVLLSLARDFILKDQLLTTYIIYCCLEIFLEFNDESTNICNHSIEIQKILMLLQELDISSNVFMIFKILETFQKILGIYIVHEVKYHTRMFHILQSVISFIRILFKNFAYLDKPGYFDDFKKYKKNYFQEKPNSFESINDFISFFKSGLALISHSNEDFNTAVVAFRTECESILPLFMDHKLYISGYLSALNILAIISDDTSASKLILQIDTKDKACLTAWKYILRKKIFDVSLLSGLILICNSITAYREIEALLRKCSKNSKILINLYSIAFRVLINYDNGDLPNKHFTISTMQKEVHKKYWYIKLAAYKINFKSKDVNDLNKTRLDIFKHPDITLDIVEEFLNDFPFPINDYYLEYFREIVSVDFKTCNSFYEYKIRVDDVIDKAENIWTRIHQGAEYLPDIINKLTNTICNISPYHYELLGYLYTKINSITNEFSSEVRIIYLLDSWRRTSAIGDEESNFIQTNFQHNPCNPEYLTSRRLPFQLIRGENPIAAIGPELNDTNTSVWLEIYNAINQMRMNCQDIINKDMILKQSVKNQLTKFLTDQNLTNNNVNKKHLFMGELYHSCSLWFTKIVHDIPIIFENLVMNDVFMEIVTDFQGYLVVGEQLIKILEIALKWVNTKLESSFCVSKKEILAWKSKIIESLRNLRVEEILYKYNFYKAEYLEIISDSSYHYLLETILNGERINMGMTTKRMNDIVKVVVEIAEIINIDINEFATQFAKLRLKLITTTQDSFCDSEGDMSMLNTSCEMSIDESRQEKKEVVNIDIHELEILSLNNSIRMAIKNSLFMFMRENSLTLHQWNNIFRYFFQTFRAGEDQDVDDLCNSDWYSSFLIFMDLQSMNLQKYQFNEINTGEYLITKKLKEFCLQDKTAVVKQLYYGTSLQTCSKGPLLKPTESFVQKNFGILRDIINTYPETIDLQDEEIKQIREKIATI